MMNVQLLKLEELKPFYLNCLEIVVGLNEWIEWTNKPTDSALEVILNCLIDIEKLDYGGFSL